MSTAFLVNPFIFLLNYLVHTSANEISISLRYFPLYSLSAAVLQSSSRPSPFCVLGRLQICLTSHEFIPRETPKVKLDGDVVMFILLSFCHRLIFVIISRKLLMLYLKIERRSPLFNVAETVAFTAVSTLALVLYIYNFRRVANYKVE